jgi:alcohol dehydrogenase (quinone), cytochrome c subunit
MKFLSRLLVVLVVLGVVGLAIALAVAYLPTTTRQIATPATLDDKLAEAGRYVAVEGDCSACHTSPDGKPFAGGLPVASPIGNIYSTNITPDRETGIGGYSLNDFDRAVRHGITPNGGTLYPAMPYPSYDKLSDADVTALYAYFMKSVAPVHAGNRPTDIRWPLSMRWPLALWRRAFAPGSSDGTFDTARYSDPIVARGAYLVEGPGHCGTCHTPRAITLQEKGLDETSPAFLSGGPVIDGWVAVNLRGNPADGLGAWSADDIAASLRTGRNPGHAVVGSPMKDVVVHSTQSMMDDDLKAIAAYLKTLTPSASVSSFKADDRTAKDLAAGKTDGRGAELYVDNCTACHKTSGLGASRTFPALAGNSTVLAENPASLIRLILDGGAMPATMTAPSNLGMPGFGGRMSDDEVAEVVTFIRNSWGNTASSVTASDVAAVRQQIERAKARADGSNTAH